MNIKLETICIRITTRCNLKCSHCWAAGFSEVKDIDLNGLLKFITILKSSVELRQVTLSGGEPTLYPHLQSLLENLIQQELYISITTNGASPKSLTEYVGQSKIANTSRLKIRISIDGWRTWHDSIRGNGAYDATIDEAVRISNEIGGIGINTVVMDKPEYVGKIFSDLCSVKITDWALITPIVRGRLKCNQSSKEEILRNIDLWKKAIKKIRPSLKLIVWDYLSHPNGGILIEADGIIKMPGISEEGDIVIGRIPSVKIESLKKHIAKRLEKDPVAFFNLQY